MPLHQPAPRAVRLAPGHLLLQHRRGQHLEDQPATADPQARVPASRVGQQRMPRDERLGRVAGAEQFGDPGHQPLRARPPGVGVHPPAMLLQPNGARPLRGGRGAPHVTVATGGGRVPGTAP